MTVLPPTTTPEWVHWTVHALLVIEIVPIFWYSLKFTHTNPKFATGLAFLNLLGSAYTVFLQIFIQSSKFGCVLFYHEAVYYLTEWNLFHHRCSLFYQTKMKLYRVLVRIFKIYNGAQLLLAILIFSLNHKHEQVGQPFGPKFCATTKDSNQIPAIYGAVATFPAGLVLWGFGCFTLCRYYFMSKRQGRASDLGVLLLILASYTLTLLSSVIIVVNAYVFQEAYPGVAVGGVVVDKVVSLGLSIMAYVRIRKRRQSTIRKSQSFKSTKKTVRQAMPSSAGATQTTGTIIPTK